MRSTLSRTAITICALAVSPGLFAGSSPYFNPLTQSTAVASPNHVNELESPWQAPAGLSYHNLLSLRSVEAQEGQSIQRVDAGGNSSMFDMLAYDPSGRYIFIPHETPFGAGVTRYDSQEDVSELLFAGDSAASGCERASPDCEGWAKDFAAFDPARWTPNGTVVLGEEWSGLGRLVEILDPLGEAPEDPLASALTEDGDYRVLETIANVAHEGINFSEKYPNRVIYYIDEWNSGSIYALVLNTPGEYAAGGQTFVLSVDAFQATGGDPSANWNEGMNSSAARFGMATWKPITNADGTPLAGVTDPFRDGPTTDPRTTPDTVRGGRAAADDVGGTPYGRPEDMEVGLLNNFNEVLYVTTTSEQAIVSIEMLGSRKAMVRQYASRETPKNLGFPATTGTLDSPDNLAQDVLGNIYVVEDSPGRGDVGGDVWFARDIDNDGVAESLDHFMSLQVAGSESTGMIFHPTEPTKFVIAVQHPTSTNLEMVSDGMGDAVWEFNLASVVPPPCEPKGENGPNAATRVGGAVPSCDWTDSNVGFSAAVEVAMTQKSSRLFRATHGTRSPMR